jgi:hypothetical protein
MKTHITVAVVCANASGVPSLQFFSVAVTEQQYEEGLHYTLAQIEAKELGYEPTTAFDQDDQAWRDMKEYARSVIAQEYAPIEVHIKLEAGQVQYVCASSPVNVFVHDDDGENSKLSTEQRDAISDSYSAGMAMSLNIAHPKKPKGDIEAIATELEGHGYKIAKRDPAVNPEHEGDWMIIDPLDSEEGYALVGSNRAELIKEAHNHLLMSGWEAKLLTHEKPLSQKQITALTCLQADLMGLSQVLGISGTMVDARYLIPTYDWQALKQTVNEMGQTFPWVTEKGMRISIPAAMVNFWTRHGDVITTATELVASTKKPLITHNTPSRAYAYFGLQLLAILNELK